MPDNKLKAWLARSGCQQYYVKFVDAGVTYDLVLELDSAALRELGVQRVGDRLRLELAIAQIKQQRLSQVFAVEDLYKLVDLHLTHNSDQLHQDLRASSISSVATARPDNSKAITLILQDGSTKKMNVTGCFNAQLIKRKAMKRLGFKLDVPYDTYIHSLVTPYKEHDYKEEDEDKEDQKEGQKDDQKDVYKDPHKEALSGISLLFDVELVTICYSPDRPEKHRVIFCPKGELPSAAAIATSRKIMMRNEGLSQWGETPRNKENPRKDFQRGQKDTGIPRPLRNFFGQRPPSELISSNLAEYFPDTNQKQLAETVRNSVRYSVRLSRRFPIINGSSPSVNKRSSVFSGISGISGGGAPALAKCNSYGSGQSHGRTASMVLVEKRVPRTVGDVMMNSISAIDEATAAGTVAAHRVSFAESSAAQRHSRIELVSVLDSEDEDEFFAAYDADLDDELVLGEEGPRKWLQGARIGAGSFGTVYLGMNPLTGELMAVKQVELPKKNGRGAGAAQRVMLAQQREMMFLKELNHENIVRYFGATTDEHHLNIFLEYVPGGSVQSMLSLYGPFEEPLIRNFVRQVLIGLAYLHGEDIIHRDIKGANILIDIKGTVKIGDFGISKKVGGDDEEDEGEGDEARPGRRASLQGLVYWMAPEVVKQTAYTKKADIWLVGCLIVEMFTGQHPFPQFSQMQAIFKIGTHITPGVPEWCTAEAREFLEKTFEIDYEKRPDARDLMLEAFLTPLIMAKEKKKK